MIAVVLVNLKYQLFLALYVVGLLCFGAIINFYEYRELCVNFACKELNLLEPVYDYIVVGCGSAGSVTALRLAQEPNISVVVLEAGPSGNWFVDVPSLGVLLLQSSVDWQYRTIPQKYAAKAFHEQSINLPMGRIVGGSGRLNNMIYIRGQSADFTDWYQDAEDYNFERDILSYFKKSEDQRGSYKEDTRFHSTDGVLAVEDLSYATPLASNFLEAVKTLGYSVEDLNSNCTTGFMQPQVNVEFGSRRTPAHYLFNHPKENLVLQTHTVVQKVLLRNKFEAYGVEYSHLGEKRTVLARKGVILSAGVVETPKLLMLSGIGPRDHLTKVGIKTKIDLPVGNNLQDHVSTGLDLVLLNVTLGVKFDDVLQPKAVFDYFYNSSGPYTVVGCEGVGAVDTTSQTYRLDELEDCAIPQTKCNNNCSIINHQNINMLSEGDCSCTCVQENKDNSTSTTNRNAFNSEHHQPDLGFMVLPGGASSDSGKHFSKTLGLSDKTWDHYFASLISEQVVTIAPVVLHPKSRGTVRLSNKDPYSHPVIDPNYLADAYDVDILLKGIEIIKRIVDTPPMKALGAKLNDKPFPGCEHLHFDTDPYWECYVRHLTLSAHHLAGTCRMGSTDDTSTVVGFDFRVRGTNNLYVADASLMPSMTSGNINAAVVMLGEKVADEIKLQHFLNRKKSAKKDIFILKQICRV